ncbi:MAG TPA: trypsin-like serine protease [Anaerolineae bacterium]|nr:trypsin-like serine protease [Anaerolineae bacterium]
MFKTNLFRIARPAAVLLVTLLLTLPGKPAGVTSAQDPQPSAENRTCSVKPQLAEIPFHVEDRQIQSGRYTAMPSVQSQVVFSTIVQSFDAPWLQVQFGAADLGRNSYVRLTAAQDGATQELNASLLEAWSRRSAMFKGDAVKIELFAAPDDKDVFFEVESAIVGDWVGGVPLSTKLPQVSEWEPATPELPWDTTPNSPNSVCSVDDRVASNAPEVGRIVPVGCTGWVISNGAFLTAGHCFTTNMTQIQFNVPPSLANGTIQPPPPNDQYPIDRSNVTWRNNGAGDDWAVFRVTANTTTTLTPPLAYGSFYRIRPQDEPATVRVTGYGVDGPAPCFGDQRQAGCNIPAPTPVPLNASSQTQQTATGAGEGRTGDHFEHRVDTQGGNSGSPILYSDLPNRQAVAIHTHGNTAAACDTDFNGGTAFTNAGLAAAINNFPGTNGNVRYVDVGYPSWTTADGTYFRPFSYITIGLNSVPSGGILSIVKGHYDTSEPMTINKNITIEAPVGAVVIGAP